MKRPADWRKSVECKQCSELERVKYRLLPMSWTVIMRHALHIAEIGVVSVLGTGMILFLIPAQPNVFHVGLIWAGISGALACGFAKREAIREYWRRNWRGTFVDFFVDGRGIKHAHHSAGFLSANLPEIRGMAYTVRIGGLNFAVKEYAEFPPKPHWCIEAADGIDNLTVREYGRAGFTGITWYQLLELVDSPFASVDGIIAAAKLKAAAIDEIERLGNELSAQEAWLNASNLVVIGLVSGMHGIVREAHAQPGTVGRSKHAATLRERIEELLHRFGFEGGFPHSKPASGHR